MSARTSLVLVGLLVIAESLLIFAPLVILGAAIDWPGSLDLRPEDVLPGATGELLGVALLASLWLAVVSVLILRHGALPRWLGASGLAIAALVALPAGELFGASLASVSLTSSVLHLWLLAVGACALWQGTRPVAARVTAEGTA